MAFACSIFCLCPAENSFVFVDQHMLFVFPKNQYWDSVSYKFVLLHDHISVQHKTVTAGAPVCEEVTVPCLFIRPSAPYFHLFVPRSEPCSSGAASARALRCPHSAKAERWARSLSQEDSPPALGRLPHSNIRECLLDLHLPRRGPVKARDHFGARTLSAEPGDRTGLLHAPTSCSV